MPTECTVDATTLDTADDPSTTDCPTQYDRPTLSGRGGWLLDQAGRCSGRHAVTQGRSWRQQRDWGQHNSGPRTTPQGQKNGPFPIFLNLEHLFCENFDCKECTFLVRDV